MYYSQDYMGQDKWVDEQLKHKRDGTFLDVGCHHYKNINNTYYFESELNWRGIGIEINSAYANEWKQYRKSPFICHDATTIDYDKLLKEHNMPEIIDYLSLDLEPPKTTLLALKKILETNYSFNCVTFETDYYREKDTRDESREMLKERGFIWMCELSNPHGPQDDYYIHKRLL